MVCKDSQFLYTFVTEHTALKIMPNLTIAIDGYSSTGKGTFAKRIAQALGVVYLDSGALYRTVTLYALQKEIISWNGDMDTRRLQEDIILNAIDISVRSRKDGDMDIFLGDDNVSSKIRLMDVADNVSAVAALPFVRNFVDNQLHRLGAKGCVMDGRDIGTAVFPNADLKIFMVADDEIRAQRRYDQMVQAGAEADYEQILKNVRQRDYIDSHRSMHPLCKAEDAVLLDNSHMTVDDQMVWLDGILKERFSISII